MEKVEASLYNQLHLPHCDPARFITNDTTLREGEQAANVSLDLEQKMKIARKLAEVGVQQVQGGYPGRSEIDKKFIQDVRRERLPIHTEALVQVFTPDWKDQIDAAVESGADVIGLMHPSSDLRLDYQKMTRRDMVERVVKAVRYAKGKLYVTRFSTTDSTRTEMNFLKEVYTAAIEAGAERILAADTAGSAIPEGIYTMVKELVDTFPVPVGIHCHNDFGLAVANTLAAVRAGATLLDVSINGLGERAGNAPMAEVFAGMKFLYGIELPYQMEKMCELSHLVEEITNVKIPDSMPLVGENAFAHKLDAHVKGIYYNNALYETISPELVGNRRYIPIGKYSGPFILRQKLKELGLDGYSDEQIKRLVRYVEKYSIAQRRALTDQEIIEVATQTSV